MLVLVLPVLIVCDLVGHGVKRPVTVEGGSKGGLKSCHLGGLTCKGDPAGRDTDMSGCCALMYQAEALYQKLFDTDG